MSDHLLPCPFCGGTDLDPLANCVECIDCGGRGPSQEEVEILCDPDFAKEQWNRRALPAVTLPDEVAKVVEEAEKMAHSIGQLAVECSDTGLAQEADTIRALTAIVTAQAAQIEGMEALRDALLTTWAESRERHLAAETALAAEREKVAKLVEALEKIAATTTPPVTTPWTHSVAADTYWQMVDSMRFAARAAIAEAGR